MDNAQVYTQRKNKFKMKILNLNDNSITDSLFDEKSPHKQKLSDLFQFLHNNKLSGIDNMIDNSESGRQVRILENLFPRTYNKEYITKICQLLKKKDKNYSKKRKNINKTQFNFDENNNLYLTLPKFKYGKRIRELINERKQYEGITTKIEDDHRPENELNEENKNHLAELIPEFFQNNNTNLEVSNYKEYKIYSNSSDSDSSLNEEDKKALFEKLRTKYKYYSEAKLKKHKDILNSNRALNNESSFTSIGNSNIVQTKRSDHLVLVKNASTYKNRNITKSVNNHPVIKNIKKLSKKLSIIKNDYSSVKNKMSSVDLFYYDKMKWNKQKLRESDKVIMHLKEFEKKRGDMFSKIMSGNEQIGLAKKSYKLNNYSLLRKNSPEEWKDTEFVNNNLNKNQQYIRLSQLNLPVLRKFNTSNL